MSDDLMVPAGETGGNPAVTRRWKEFPRFPLPGTVKRANRLAVTRV